MWCAIWLACACEAHLLPLPPLLPPLLAGVGGLSGVLGWTEAQRATTRGEGFAGGAFNIIKYVAVLLVIDLMWFGYEVRQLAGWRRGGGGAVVQWCSGMGGGRGALGGARGRAVVGAPGLPGMWGGLTGATHSHARSPARRSAPTATSTHSLLPPASERAYKPCGGGVQPRSQSPTEA